MYGLSLLVFQSWIQISRLCIQCCHDFTMLSVNISDITVITVENVDYRCIITTLANLKQLIY